MKKTENPEQKTSPGRSPPGFGMNARMPGAYDLIIAVLVLLAFLNGWLLGILPVAVLSVSLAVVCTVLVQAAIEYYQTRKFILSKSAIVSGLIIGLIVQPANFLQIVAAAVLAMVIKKLLLKDKMPIFNPAASGMFIVFALSNGAGEVWWGNGILQKGMDTLMGRETGIVVSVLGILALLLGVLVSWRIRKLPITASYLLGFAAVIAWQQGVGHIFDFLPFFSAFFMLVEPKTTPNLPLSQIIFGLLVVALAQVFLFLHLPSAFLLAILVGNGIGKLVLK